MKYLEQDAMECLVYDDTVLSVAGPQSQWGFLRAVGVQDGGKP